MKITKCDIVNDLYGDDGFHYRIWLNKNTLIFNKRSYSRKSDAIRAACDIAAKFNLYINIKES